MDESRIRFSVPTEGPVYEDENIKVEYFRTKHTANSYSILVTEGQKRVLFGGDFSGGLQGNDVPAVIREELDLFVCELAHFSLAKLDPYLQDCRAAKVYFNHVFPEGKFDDIENAKGKYPFTVYAVKDGDTVEI